MPKFVFSTKGALQEALRSPIIASLWAGPSRLGVNSVQTLPLEIRGKPEITDEIKSSGKSGVRLKWSANMAYAKELLKFYKHGVKTVWGNNRELSRLKKEYKLADKVTNSGGLAKSTEGSVDIRVPNFRVLTSEMSQALYMARVQEKKTDQQLLKDHSKKDEVYNLFAMPRSEYLLFRRTPQDFYKLPTFTVIFAIFAEMTPLLCYAFPEITPLTCILPTLLPRLWTRKNYQKVAQLTESAAQSEKPDSLALQTAYNLPKDQVHALANALRLKTKYIPASLFPMLVLRDRLHQHHNFLLVDNYYLSGLNGNGNVWDLTRQEVLRACLDRNLVANVAEITSKESLPADKRLAQLDPIIDHLRLKLMQLIANYENIGSLAVALLDPEPPTEALLWHKEYVQKQGI